MEANQSGYEKWEGRKKKRLKGRKGRWNIYSSSNTRVRTKEKQN